MPYKSLLAAHRRKMILYGIIGGALFSLVSQLSFGVITFAAMAASCSLGMIEGLLIVSTGSLMDTVFPSLSVKKAARMAGIFLGAFFLHTLISGALYLTGLGNTFFLAGIIALLSVAAGEWAVQWEKNLIREESEKLAEEGKSRMPTGIPARFGFSEREAEVAELLLARATYKEMTEMLFISLATVKSHCSAVYRKADVAGRKELIDLIGKDNPER